MNIAIFGFHDTYTGQIYNFLDDKLKSRVKFIITPTPIPKLLHTKGKGPNKNVEYVKNNKIFNLKVHYKKKFINFLTQNKITHVFVLIEDKKIRSDVFSELNKKNIKILSYIHPSVKFGGKNKIGKGVVIFPDCYLGYKTEVHQGVIIETNSKIEHHTIIQKFCNIYPNFKIAGQSLVSSFCTIAFSVDVIDKIKIQNNCFIGAGSLVLKNTVKNGIYYGRPAKLIRKNL